MSTAPPSLDSIIEAAIRRLGKHASASDVEMEAIKMLERRSPAASATFPTPTFCLSISVAACSSRRSATQFARVYDLLRMTIDAFRWDVAEALNSDHRAEACTLELHVRQSAHLFDGHPPKEVLSVATALANLARDTGVKRVYGPFLDLSHASNLSFVEVIPDLLSVHPAIHPVFQIGTREQGLDPQTIRALSLALRIRGQNRPSAEAGSSGASVIVNGCDQRAFGHRVHSDDVLFSVAMPASHSESTSTTMGTIAEPQGSVSAGREVATRVAQVGAAADRTWRYTPSVPGCPPHTGSPSTHNDQRHRTPGNAPISCTSLTDPLILDDELARQLGAWNDSGLTGWTDVHFPVR